MAWYPCSVCGSPFKARPRDLPKRKHCSRRCAGQSREYCACDVCGTIFSYGLFHAPTVRGCSPECKARLRFWKQVAKSPDPDGCWLWTGSTTTQGYGQTRRFPGERLAHRIAWRLERGGSPDGMLRNTCGNRRCVRPDHWYKACGSRGEQVQVIRHAYALVEGGYKALARRFGLTPQVVAKIVKRKQGRSVSDCPCGCALTPVIPAARATPGKAGHKKPRPPYNPRDKADYERFIREYQAPVSD